jgi:hypothetical protein
MKIIITEEQYEELGDWDIYSKLPPYYRRRIDYIDIKSSLEKNIKKCHRMISSESPNDAVDGIIYKTIWNTIPLRYNVNIDDSEFEEYYRIIYPQIYIKYGDYVMNEVDKIRKELDDEDYY